MQKLVSVCVITYNSSEFVLETLESIKNQTYKNIELIISDDCSQDDTLQVIYEWKKNNIERFSSIKIISVEKNTGVAINLKRSIEASTGEWIKIIAGDDILRNDCIDIFMKNVEKTNNEFYICNIEPFVKRGEVPRKIIDNYAYLFYRSTKSLKTKKRRVLYTLEFPGPAWFFSKRCYKAVGGIDENYSMMDEWPFIYSILSKNFNISPVKDKLIYYRISQNSLSHQNQSFGNPIMIKQNKEFFYNVRLKDLRRKKRYLTILDQRVFYKVKDRQISKFYKTSRVNNAVLFLYRLNPIYIYNKLAFIFWKLINE